MQSKRKEVKEMPWKLLLMAHLHQFLSSGRNIFRLTSSPSYQNPGARPLPQDKNLVIGGGFRNGKPTVSMRRGSAESVRPLHADHKEADTTLL